VANKLTKSKRDAFYAAIGRFVLTWAEVEVYLDLLVLKLRDPTEDVSHQLSAKIQFIRKTLRSKSTSGAMNILRLISEIEKLSDTRHDYVQGARIKLSFERSELSVTLGRLLQPRSQLRKNPVRVTATEIEKVTDQLDALGGELLDALETLVAQPRLH